MLGPTHHALSTVGTGDTETGEDTEPGGPLPTFFQNPVDNPPRREQVLGVVPI
jgi:hypothetical protein